MPFLTYQCGEDKAVEYAGKIIQSTYAKAVKVEGAEPEIQKVISRLIRMGIPVMAVSYTHLTLPTNREV